MRIDGVPIVLFVGGSLIGCAVSQPPGQTESSSQKLQTVVIPNERLCGLPRQIVAQLNKLSRKCDVPDHKGLRIVFDPAVDSECCNSAIFRRGEPLANWLQDVCGSCGSRYRIEGNRIVIELLPISEKQTPNLETQLTNGIVDLCQQFRAKRGQERFTLGEQIFDLLPRSPVTWSKEVPMHHYVSYDFRHPSYTLYKKDVLLLLGEPDRNVNNEVFGYSLRPRGAGFAELSVEFGEYDYVINPGLHWR